jgi:pimeloyl-ACP methyl ester carboxylesterase
MNVYFISGIGGDRRLFNYIQLPEDFHVGYVDWILPEKKENLPDYANRLTEQIDTGQPFILVGASLGGIMAVEIAKRLTPVATILISSIPVSAQLPAYYTAARHLRLARLLPTSFIKGASNFKRLFTREKGADKKLMRQMIRDGDPRFIKWGLNAVLEWRNEEIPQPLWHIHGARDEVFPIRLTHPSHKIPRAGHLLVMSHAEEVNRILREILLSLTGFALVPEPSLVP